MKTSGDHTIRKDRRKFFGRIGLYFLTGLTTQPVLADTNEHQSEGRVKMLSQDGRLVEIESSLYDGVRKKISASHKQILNWFTRRNASSQD